MILKNETKEMHKTNRLLDTEETVVTMGRGANRKGSRRSPFSSLRRRKGDSLWAGGGEVGMEEEHLLFFVCFYSHFLLSSHL